ncbi:MAG TPA: aldose epimerase family protein [Polyangiaceae bacterium]|nr:aldose epimerase family protein [Polyangiaceae bacterium]
MRSKLLALALLTACSQASPPPNPPPAPLPTVEAPSAPPPASATPPAPPSPRAVERSAFGKIDGKDVWLFTLTNRHGLTVKITNFGATVTSLLVPDKSGKLADIVLGYEKVESYASGGSYFGATIGRVANRIRDAKFKLEGKDYTLAPNDKPHALHGGTTGWSKHLWEATEPAETADGPALKLTYVSKDGEEGYPGTVTATTTYTLTQNDELRIEMEAVSDRTTLVNMAHHGYWNLGGVGSGPITDHELTLFADAYTPGEGLVPTGAVKPVKGTPFDFTTAKPIGKDLTKTGLKPVGYDHNFVVRGDANALRPVAKLRDPKSGRVLTLEANQPGVQFYSGNFLDGSIHEKGTTYPQYAAICLESQKFPNAINVPAWRDQVILKAGEKYHHVMVHRFSVE